MKNRTFRMHLLFAFAVILGFAPLYGQSHSGMLDPSFGAGGKVQTEFGGAGDLAQSVALQPDGKLVAAGTATRNGSTDFALTRYSTSGALDAGFGTGGKVTTDFGGSFDSVASVAIQLAGKIVAAGWTAVNGIAKFA